MNVRDAFYEVLRSDGITTIFGNPGKPASSAELKGSQPEPGGPMR